MSSGGTSLTWLVWQSEWGMLWRACCGWARLGEVASGMESQAACMHETSRICIANTLSRPSSVSRSSVLRRLHVFLHDRAT